MTTVADDNTTYKVLVEQGSTPASPAAGKQKIFIDSADHLLKRVNSAGTVTIIEAASAVDDTAYNATTWNGDTTHAPSKNAVRDKIEAMSAGASVLVQRVISQDGAVATGTTTVPLDDTIPQNTEGVQFLTVTITPTNASNILYIDIVVFAGHSAGSSWVITALFQDTTAGALAAGMAFAGTGTQIIPMRFTHKMVAGTTSATTFKVRVGGHQAGTTTFNGISGARYLGGVMASSITVSELTP